MGLPEDTAKVWHFDEKVEVVAANAFGDTLFLGFGNGVVGFLTTDGSSGGSFETKDAALPAPQDHHGNGRNEARHSTPGGKRETEGKAKKFNFENAGDVRSPDFRAVNDGDSIVSDARTARFPPVSQRWTGSQFTSPDKPRRDDFRCFKVHQDAVSAIAFYGEERTVVTGTVGGEVCGLTEEGTLVARKADFKGAIVQLKLLERHPDLFRSLGMAKDADGKAADAPTIGGFGKVIEDNAFAKHETVMLAPRTRKIRKENHKVSLTQFLTVFGGGGSGQGAPSPVAAGPSLAEFEKMQKEIAQLRQANARLLSVCAKLDKLRDD